MLMLLFEITSFLNNVNRWLKISLWQGADKLQKGKTYESSFKYPNELEGNLEIDLGERYEIAFAFHLGHYNGIWLSLWDWKQKPRSYLIGKINIER